MASTLPRLLIAASASLLLACATTSAKSTHVDATAFSLSVAKAREHVTVVFEGLNELAREDLLDHAAAQPTLNDNLFLQLLDTESRTTWDRSLLGLETYGLHLAALTSQGASEAFRAEAIALAEQVKKTGESLQEAKLGSTEIPSSAAGIATALTKIGEWLIAARAQRSAESAMQAADPNVAVLIAQLEGVIGTSNNDGLRGTAWSHWKQRKAEVIAEFVAAPASERRPLVVRYANLMSKQQAHDADLAGLSRSLRALAAGHHAMAEGREASASALAQAIAAEVASAKKLHAVLENALGSNN